MIEAGKHRGRALRGELGLSSGGHEQIGIEFEFLDLPGTRYSYYGTFSDGGSQYTIEAMRAAGFQGDDVTDMSWFEGDTPEVILVVVHETYQGKTRAKIKFVNRIGGLAMKNQIDGARLREFVARMRGELAVLDGNAPPHDPAQAPQRGGSGNRPPTLPTLPRGRGPSRPAQDSNDDIPF